MSRAMREHRAAGNYKVSRLPQRLLNLERRRSLCGGSPERRRRVLRCEYGHIHDHYSRCAAPAVLPCLLATHASTSRSRPESIVLPAPHQPRLRTAPPCPSAARSPSPRVRPRRRPWSPRPPSPLPPLPRPRCRPRARRRGHPSPRTRRAATTPTSRLPVRHSCPPSPFPPGPRRLRLPPLVLEFEHTPRGAPLLAPRSGAARRALRRREKCEYEHDDVPLSPLFAPAPASSSSSPPPIEDGECSSIEYADVDVDENDDEQPAYFPLRRGVPITRASTGSARSDRAGPPLPSHPCTCTPPTRTRTHMRRARPGHSRSRGGTSLRFAREGCSEARCVPSARHHRESTGRKKGKRKRLPAADMRVLGLGAASASPSTSSSNSSSPASAATPTAPTSSSFLALQTPATAQFASCPSHSPPPLPRRPRSTQPTRPSAPTSLCGIPGSQRAGSRWAQGEAGEGGKG
ncbi:hypothetical protein DFH09DRAFT_198757 [Mycena vulgaris]|nr:hypothetical protein DFH09DRAFT_198757 [Mycena vulgaris]